jgi:hypothetical protein
VRCLALTNIAVFKTIVFPKLWYFCSIEKRGPTLFFLKLRNEKNDASYIARVSKSPPHHICSRSSLGPMEKHMGASRKRASPRPSLRWEDLGGTVQWSRPLQLAQEDGARCRPAPTPLEHCTTPSNQFTTAIAATLLGKTWFYMRQNHNKAALAKRLCVFAKTSKNCGFKKLKYSFARHGNTMIL